MSELLGAALVGGYGLLAVLAVRAVLLRRPGRHDPDR